MTYPNANSVLDLDEQVDVTALYEVQADGCWVWRGRLTTIGYGSLYVKRTHLTAHRLTYEQVHGRIPEGFVLDHLCRVRACVNPDHLEPVTQRENLRRSGTWERTAAKTHCPYGHAYTPENTYVLPKSGSRTCRTCTKRRRAEYVRRRKELPALRAG